MTTVVRATEILLNEAEFVSTHDSTLLTHRSLEQCETEVPVDVERFAGLVAYQKWCGIGTTEPCYALLASRILSEFDRAAPLRVLDVGSGVGRVMYDLARVYENSVLVGVDVERNALLFGQQLICSTGYTKISLENYGVSDRVSIPRLGRHNALFIHADVMACSFIPASFDVIVVCSVLDRLSDPLRALERFSSWLAADGMLLVLCPANFVSAAHWSALGTLRQLQAACDAVQLRVAEAFEGVPMILSVDGRRSSQNWDARFVLARKG